jgi:hypothetical protein
MQKILRASKVEASTGGSEAFRVVLVHREGEYAPLVVWVQVFPKGREPFFSTGDYHQADEVDEAHKRFQVRRDRWHLEEDFDHENTYTETLNATRGGAQ